MSKKSNANWDAVAIGAVSVFLGLVALAFTRSIFNLFFVPVVVAVLWSYTGKVNKLEARLSQLEERILNTRKENADPSSSS